MSILRRLRHRLTGNRIAQEIDDEIRQHLEMRVDEYRRAGLSPRAARIAARRRFGDTSRVRSDCLASYHLQNHAVLGSTVMESIWQDVRYALRSLTRQPAFTIVAVGTLAVGVGANTLVFSAVNSTMLDPLPFDDADRLAFVWLANDAGRMRLTPDLVTVSAWRESATTLEGMATYGRLEMVMGVDGEPRAQQVAAVSLQFLPLLGVQPRLGRPFLPSDTVAGAPRVALIGETYWKQEFGGARDAVGNTLLLDDHRYTIVGVLPARVDAFFGADQLPIWVPSSDSRLTLVKVNATTTRDAAQEELARIHSRIEPEHRFSGDWSPALFGPLDNVARDFRTGLWVLLGAVGFVLLVACVNVANMLLARGVARRHELAVRTAIGASRWRVRRQLLVEALIMTGLAAAAGTIAAAVGLGALREHLPEGLTRLRHARLDDTVLSVTVAMTVLTGLVFGLVPAGQVRGVNAAEMLSQGQRAGAPPGRSRARQILVAVECATSVVLFIGAALMVTSLLRLERRDPGFDATNLVSFQIRLPEDRSADASVQAGFFEDLLLRVKQLPAVQDVALGSVGTPYGYMEGEIVIDGSTQPVEGSQGFAINVVSASYFAVIGAPPIQGRGFLPSETAGGEARVAVVNETFARTFWPDGDILGGRFRFSRSSEWTTVVGVVRDVNIRGLQTGPPEYLVYYPTGTFSGVQQQTVAVRAHGNPRQVIPLLQGQVWSIEPNLPLHELAVVTDVLSDAIARPRFNAVLLVSFAGVALALAAVGVYSVIALSLQQRLHELGVRIALGARPADVVRLMVRSGLQPILAGGVAGSLLALGLARSIESLLFEVQPTDPRIYGGALIGLTLVGLGASYLPARRAMRVDPVQALRGE